MCRPIVFVHGVNSRTGGTHDRDRDRAARDEVLRLLVLEPLAARRPNVEKITILNISQCVWDQFLD